MKKKLATFLFFVILHGLTAVLLDKFAGLNVEGPGWAVGLYLASAGIFYIAAWELAKSLPKNDYSRPHEEDEASDSSQPENGPRS